MLLEITSLIYMIFYKATGAGKRNRTPDLLITNELLYRRTTGVLSMFLTVPVCFIRRKYANGFNHQKRKDLPSGGAKERAPVRQ